LVGHQLLQMSPTLRGQERLASAQVGLRLQGAPRLEVLPHPSHRGHAKTAKGRDLNGALVLVVELQDSLTHCHRDGFHTHTFASLLLL
jgi:hypothetical protein